MQKKTVKGIDYFLYEDEIEFRKFHLGSDVKPWRDDDVVEGDWIKTDEGGITKCLRSYRFKDNSKVVVTICGSFKVGTHKMDNTVRKYHNRFVSLKGTQTHQKEMPFSKKDKAFTRLTMLGMGEIEAFKKINPDAKVTKYIKQRISTITNKRGYQEYMEKTFIEMLNQSKMTEEWSLENLKKLVEDKTLTDHGNYRVSPSVQEKILTNTLEYHGKIAQIKQIETRSWYAENKITDGELKEVKKIGEKKKIESDKLEIE